MAMPMGYLPTENDDEPSHVCVCACVNLKLINDKQVEEALLTVTRNDFSVFKGQNQTAQAR